MNEQGDERVALVIVAHPDDAEFSCAGTVAAWVREGWAVSYVICTDASGGGPDEATDVSPAARQRISDLRKQEQRRAGDILGLRDVVFLDYPDGRLLPSLELRRDLVRMLRRYRPARVICTSPDRVWAPSYFINRHHPDHLAAGQAALAAIYPAAQNPWDFPELLDEGLRPHKISEIFVTGAPVLNYAVDISATLETKFAALQAHASQIGDRFAELEPRLRHGAAEEGKPYGFAYAESFHRIENH